jgi:3-isopropylmalate dehydrogenase
MFEMSFNLTKESNLIKKVVDISLEKDIVTEDLSDSKKSYGTSEVGDFLVKEILNN